MPITDHDHVVQRTGSGFVRSECGKCKGPLTHHVSWGRLIARRAEGLTISELGEMRRNAPS